MLDKGRNGPERPERLPMDYSKLTANLRLLGLLALLIPLFAGLQYVVREGVPRVEVRLVAQDVQTSVPVERVVERVVYVPVGGEAAVPPTERPEPARAILSAALPATERSDVQVGGLPSTEVAGREPEPAAPFVDAEPAPEAPPLLGTVALAPPPAPAPIVAARAAPVAPVVPQAQAAEYVVEAEADEMIAEAEVVDDETVAGATEGGPEVAEAADEPGEEVAVVQFVSDEPVMLDDEGASIAMLRHELSVRERRAEAAPEPAAEADAAAEEPVADVEAAGVQEVTADEQDAAPEPIVATGDESEVEEPVADGDEPVSEASPGSSEELLSQAPTVTTEMFDHGSNDEQSLGVLKHQLVARPAGPAPATGDRDQGSGPEEEGPAAVADATEEAVRPEVAVSEDAGADEGPVADTEGPEEEPVAGTDGGAQEVARVEEGAGAAEEPEQ